jgi:hypothetical protein
VVPKHRRSEIEPSRASRRAPASTAEVWPEAVGYGPAATFRPAARGAGFGYAGHGYRGPAAYDGTGYDNTGAEPGWEVAHEIQTWQEWEDWQDWGPPPALHPDHPSAPVPRIQFPDEHPSRPMPAPRVSGPPESARWRRDEPARTWSAPPQPPDGYDNGNRWLYAVPDEPAIPDYEASDFQQQPHPGWQETTGYRREADPYGPDRGPAAGRYENGYPPGRDSLWTAGQVVSLAEGRAAQIAHQAQDYAAAIRDAAEREAAAITQQATGHAATMRDTAERQAAEIRQAADHQAAAITQQATGQAAEIRDAAEREVAELRARLDSMSGELGRVAALVTERLGAPPMPATAPELPEVTLAPPGTRPAPPDGTPAKPATKPAGPKTAPASQPREPGTRTAKPGTAPRTTPGGPARQTATPAKQGQAQGRQRRAMRIVTAGTAALLSVAAVGAVTMTGIHGFSFFVFREAGQGETPGKFTDADFLARQAAAQHHALAPKAAQHHDPAPKGRHHKAAGSK